jgi:hypothetical protein
MLLALVRLVQVRVYHRSKLGASIVPLNPGKLVVHTVATPIVAE